jgi:hypothetical protein
MWKNVRSGNLKATDTSEVMIDPKHVVSMEYLKYLVD